MLESQPWLISTGLLCSQTRQKSRETECCFCVEENDDKKKSHHHHDFPLLPSSEDISILSWSGETRSESVRDSRRGAFMTKIACVPLASQLELGSTGRRVGFLGPRHFEEHLARRAPSGAVRRMKENNEVVVRPSSGYARICLSSCQHFGVQEVDPAPRRPQVLQPQMQAGLGHTHGRHAVSFIRDEDRV